MLALSFRQSTAPLTCIRRAQAGHTPLHITAARGDVEATKLLISKGANLNLTNAVRSGAFLCVLRVIKMNGGGGSYHSGVVMGQVFENGEASVGVMAGCTALQLAVAQGRRDTVVMLLEAAVKEEETAKAGRSASGGDSPSARQGARRALAMKSTPQKGEAWDEDLRPPSRRRSTLHQACATGNFNLLQILIDRGDDLDIQDTADGSSPLHLACSNGSLEVIELLLEEGADPAAVDDDGSTALHYAALKSSRPVVDLLLRMACIDADTHNDLGRTPLHEAARVGNIDAMSTLIQNGASCKETDKNGDTPFVLAQKRKQKSAMMVLQGAASGVDITNLTGSGSGYDSIMPMPFFGSTDDPEVADRQLGVVGENTRRANEEGCSLDLPVMCQIA
eukprot:gene8347-9921_t